MIAVNLDQVIADFDRAIELDPTDTLAYYNRGNAHSDLGDLDAALADYQSALALTDDPGVQGRDPAGDRRPRIAAGGPPTGGSA